MGGMPLLHHCAGRQRNGVSGAARLATLQHERARFEACRRIQVGLERGVVRAAVVANDRLRVNITCPVAEIQWLSPLVMKAASVPSRNISVWQSEGAVADGLPLEIGDARLAGFLGRLFAAGHRDLPVPPRLVWRTGRNLFHRVHRVGDCDCLQQDALGTSSGGAWSRSVMANCWPVPVGCGSRKLWVRAVVDVWRPRP